MSIIILQHTNNIAYSFETSDTTIEQISKAVQELHVSRPIYAEWSSSIKPTLTIFSLLGLDQV